MQEINEIIGERISLARKNKKMSAVELSNVTGFSGARISHWEQGRRMPNIESIHVLSAALDTTPAYLLALDDVKINEGNTQTKIPLVNFNDANSSQSTSFLEIEPNHNNELFATTLVDESMSPPFFKGDVVVFERNTQAKDGDFLLIQIKKTNQILFRRFSIDYSDIENPSYTIEPMNKDFQIIKANDLELFSILGVYRNKYRVFL